MKFFSTLLKAPLSALVGLLLCTLFGLVAVFASWIAPYDGAAIVADVWAPMSPAHLLGTDNLGRDLFSRLIHGTRTTLLIAGLATILSFTLGSVTGFVAAVSGGWVDTVLSRFVDVLMAIPTLIFALVVLSVFPSTVPVLILVMGILDSTRVYRLSRAVAMDINVMDFVEAARLRGEKTTWIVFREILPNALTPLVSELGLRFIFAVLFLSSLSFLGLGVQPPEADWGGLVKENKEGIVFGLPAALAPAAAIALLTIAVNLVADWVLSITTNIRGEQGHV
jgi:peptide/nickel transport system permease protein